MNKFHPNWKSLSDCTKCGEFMGHGHECLANSKFTQGMDVQTSPFPQQSEFSALRSELAAAQKEVERLTAENCRLKLERVESDGCLVRADDKRKLSEQREQTMRQALQTIADGDWSTGYATSIAKRALHTEVTK